MRGRFIIGIFLIFFSLFSWARVPLRVGVPTGQDPHFFLIDNEPQGPEGLAVNTALQKAGFSPRYTHFPSLRAIERLQIGQIDAIVNVKESSLPFAFKSSYSYEFKNCAVTRVKRKVSLRTAQDFRGLDVVAFKNAKISLETGHINEIIRLAKSYREIQDVDTRIKLLKAGRVDVMLSEKSVFISYLEKFALGSPEEYQFQCIFEPTRYYLFFRDKELRNQFDKSRAR